MLRHPERLVNVHSELIRLLTDGGLGGLELIVIQGARTVAEEQAAMDSGHSALHNPLDSKHVIDPVYRPLALAVDVAPFDHPPTAEDWKNIPAFEAMGSNLKALADSLGIPILWGGDWHSLKDFDHIELAAAHAESAAA